MLKLNLAKYKSKWYIPIIFELHMYEIYWYVLNASLTV